MNDITFKKYKFNPMYFNPITVLISITIIFRLFLIDSPGYSGDIDIFKYWANELYKKSLGNFYYTDLFTDYPPLYMYILYIIGFFKNLLNLPANSSFYTVLIKLPAIFFDVLTVILIYKIAVKKFLPKKAFLLSLFYSLNPAIFIDSAIWGQVDSIYTFLLLLAVYFIASDEGVFIKDINRNYLFAYILFTLSALTKPQTFIFTPIFIFSFISFFYTNYSKKQKIHTSLVSILICLTISILICLPFINGLDVMVIVNQYIGTLSQYDYTTLNAYNFYGLIGKNFIDSSQFLLPGITYKLFGTLSIVFFTIIVLNFLYENRHNKFSLFFGSAFINLSVFMFSIKMHERYLFPTLAFLLVSYIYKRDKRLLILFFSFSFTFFVNCSDVIKLSMFDFDYSILKYGFMVISIINMILFFYMFYLVIRWSMFNKVVVYDDDSVNTEEEFSYIVNKPEKSLPFAKTTKKDIIYILCITLIYSFIAFYKLGDFDNPQTCFVGNKNDAVQITFDEPVNFVYLTSYLGTKHDKDISLEFYDETSKSFLSKEVNMKSVFYWNNNIIGGETSSVLITFLDDNTYINELAFLDRDKNMIPFEVTYVSDGLEKDEVLNLFDEQHLVETESTYMNSTYFDEIYYPRTAYEFLHKITPYETTHPPLGKDIMALSIKLFGMNPFAYRLPGVLAGILMIPFIYLFSLKMFKSSEFALFTSILLSFDFMHFTQTRIATIDSFVTLFILIMFYYMYLYYESNFYYDDNKKLLKYLCLSGLFMGLAVSVKWTGVYGGVGLAIIFFMTMFNRFNEYIFETKTENYTVTKTFKNKSIKTIGFCILFFVIIPLIIYSLSYIPFLQATNTPFSISAIIDSQESMLSYHTELTATHPFASDYWTWLIMLRPVYYYAKTFENGLVAGISAFGNPLVWYVGTISIFYTFISAKGENKKRAIFLLVGYFSMVVPWILVPRTMFMYHYFPATIFLVLMITNMFIEIFKTFKNKYVILYLILVVLTFILFYPVISGMPISPEYMKPLRILPTWVIGPVV